MNEHTRDEFGEYAGAYVLGALSPQERHDFEAHVRECPDCAEAVQELAGLPGLLATVPREVAEARPAGPVPDTLLPRLIGAVRARERRRRWLTAAAAAAVATALSVGGLTLTGAPGDHGASTAQSGTGTGSPSGRGAAHSTAMTVVGSTPLRADLAMEQVAWGTRLDLRCTYPATTASTGGGPGYGSSGGAAGGTGAGPAYELVVRSRSGQLQRVATWQAVPGKTITVTGATSWSRADIASVQVRAASGHPLLELAG
ncbi:MAG TPA: zf-HC2 domain-containing protein [Segeticoccus sp.]|uniref:anti-sigma factor family protein n=1 Tax=Segeticoccus sp. TaxID=2706531 RepID=UPI002D7EAD08|nr:zf-HC2 domain-containing protein [Segeticoccus sp.]HET8599396.1 zf-HC2 domain-containing protein [Segeticoccus sp.]